MKKKTCLIMSFFLFAVLYCDSEKVYTSNLNGNMGYLEYVVPSGQNYCFKKIDDDKGFLYTKKIVIK